MLWFNINYQLCLRLKSYLFMLLLNLNELVCYYLIVLYYQLLLFHLIIRLILLPIINFYNFFHSHHFLNPFFRLRLWITLLDQLRYLVNWWIHWFYFNCVLLLEDGDHFLQFCDFIVFFGDELLEELDKVVLFFLDFGGWGLFSECICLGFWSFLLWLGYFFLRFCLSFLI